MQNAMLAPIRFQWGDKFNLLVSLIFQVLAIVLLISIPFTVGGWPAGDSQLYAVNRWMYLYVPYFLGLIFLASSIWVLSQRKDDAAGQTYSIFAALMAVSLFCLFDVITSQRLFSIWMVSVSLSSGALINLAFIYPDQVRFNIPRATSHYLGYLPSVILVVLTFALQILSGSEEKFAIILLLELIFIVLAFFFFFCATLMRRIGSPSPMVREQARLILWGYGLAFVPPLVLSLVNFIRTDIQLHPAFFILISAFPVSLTYTLLRYKSLGGISLLKRSIIYGTLLVLIAGSYALLVSGLSLLLGNRLDYNPPILVGAIVFLIALMFYPLRSNLQARVDTIFFKRDATFQVSLQSFGHQLTRQTEIISILNLVRQVINTSFSPSGIYIFTIDDSSNYYVAAPNTDGSSSSEIHFSRSGALVELLIKQAKTVNLSYSNKFPADLLVDQARIAVLQADLFVPILGQAGMLGWLAIGPKRSGEPYSTDDIYFLESLCDQTSIALERSQVISALEKRIHEMDTITKVAEQINQKLALDDLLDMFYNETHNLVPTVDFRITLKSEVGDEYHHVFYISDNHRVLRRENQPFLAKQSLETVVIQSQYPIVTGDYAGECQRRKMSAESKDIHAWMSVPLMAGDQTIGAVCVGSRDPAVIYQSEQVNLLQAVADLVAGAIVKTRLLDESQKQAHQMATLNELTRSLTSTLELNPLLNRIMESAVEILDCEAGSLLLVDEETGESVFEVAIGPVGTDLEGHRLPPGTGLVGRAIDSKKAIIENNVRKSDDWFDADKKTGFSSKDLLVVPLLVKEQVIGVLEVLNKKDGSPFYQKDLELLTAFAGQMAVAIENARLYTQTDQALAARVGELSIMQKIDQELNASLDIQHVMSITLESAMRHTQASAGLIGSMEKDGLRVNALQGFIDESIEVGSMVTADHLAGLQGALIREDAPALITRIWQPEPGDGRGKERLTHRAEIEPAQRMPVLTSQILIPIKRKSEMKSVIYLATTAKSVFTPEDVEFLSRLSDHAAIAISNAQLYEEVQAANKAKSEFVSAAAHELKNPLTSIKGYSDLLVAGTVGPVNEGQAGFLTTIRSNAERMRTLVSDLQDISRIEAGQLLLNLESHSLDEILQEVASSFESQIAEKGQQLEIYLPENLPPVWCDNTRMVQVLTNLVSNANKYSPAGGFIKITAEHIIQGMPAEGTPSLIQVSVADNGYGISSGDQKKIFEQFFRSEDSRIRESTGTGLGLSISKRLVEIQGGRLWYDTELDQGTTFYFTIQTANHD